MSPKGLRRQGINFISEETHVRHILATVAMLAMAGCGGDGPNPVAADGSRPALTGTSLPNLYVSSITHNGSSVTVVVCNNGSASAGASITYVSHWAGLYHEGFDVNVPSLNAGVCSQKISSVYPGLPGVTHSYNVYADDYQQVTESNENDNHASLQV